MLENASDETVRALVVSALVVSVVVVRVCALSVAAVRPVAPTVPATELAISEQSLGDRIGWAVELFSQLDERQRLAQAEAPQAG